MDDIGFYKEIEKIAERIASTSLFSYSNICDSLKISYMSFVSRGDSKLDAKSAVLKYAKLIDDGKIFVDPHTFVELLGIERYTDFKLKANSICFPKKKQFQTVEFTKRRAKMRKKSKPKNRTVYR